MSSLDIEVQGIFHVELLRLVLLPENSHHRNQACLWRLSPFNLTLLHQVIHELQYSLQVTMLAIPDNISFIRIEKSPFSWWRRNSKANTSSGSHKRTKRGETKNKRKTKNTHRYEQKCQSHTCSGTINSSMYGSDLTITTSLLTSSAPLQWVKAGDKHHPTNWVSAAIPEATGRLSHTTG